MILQYFNKKESNERIKAEKIYKSILIKSNIFIKDDNLIDVKDYNTSFELVTIYLIIYMQIGINLKIKNFKLINEILISLFINDLDESLRSKGIGDMSIGKYVKSYVKKFYYRLKIFPNLNNGFNKDILNKYFLLNKLFNKKMYLLASQKIHKEYETISKEYKQI